MCRYNCLLKSAQCVTPSQLRQCQTGPGVECSGEGCDAGSEMAEVVAFLRREKETLEVQLSLAEQEAARWKGQAAHAERAAAAALQVSTCIQELGHCLL